MREPKHEIGQTVEAKHKGGKVRGRIVGYEDGAGLRDFPNGWVYLLEVDGADTWIKVAERAIAKVASGRAE